MNMTLPVPTVEARPGGRVEVQLSELVLPLDSGEREKWRAASCKLVKGHPGPCEPINASTIYTLLRDIGIGPNEPTIFNKKQSAYFHQPLNHYCEIKLASHLIRNCDFLSHDIFYENWRISADSSALSYATGDGLQRNGARKVQECLGNAFLREMAKLIKRNATAHIKSFFPDPPIPRNARPPRHDDHVDLFAFNATVGRCAILEVKQNDEVAGHQAILMAFAAYLFSERRSELRLGPDLNAHLGFVRFRLPPREPYPIIRVSFIIA